MASDPSSGPGSGLVASKTTALSSAQLLALFTTPIAVSPTPRSDQIIVPLQWAAAAVNSSAFYNNPAAGSLNVGYHPRGEQVALSNLLSALTSGDPSFFLSLQADVNRSDITGIAGSALEISMDTGNLTTGTFPITFTLFYVIVAST